MLERLIYMVNQIARNLSFSRDPQAAVAEHIAKFWDPRMRAEILAHLRAGGAGLSPISAGALERLAETSRPHDAATAGRPGTE